VINFDVYLTIAFAISLSEQNGSFRSWSGIVSIIGS
jgi:hypothetical protein